MHRLLPSASAVLLMCLSVACEEDAKKSGNDGQNQDPATVRADLDREGGVVKFGDGARLLIPAGALTEATEVSVTEVMQPPSNDATTAVTKHYRFGPADLAFDKPVRLKLPLSDSLGDQDLERVRLAWSTDEGGSWEILAATVEDGALIADIEHFCIGVGVLQNLCGDPCGDDGNPCTSNTCTPGYGCFKPLNNGDPCAENACQELGASCFNGTCIGVSVDCDDGKDCTADRCDPLTGCYTELATHDAVFLPPNNDGHQITDVEVGADGTVYAVFPEYQEIRTYSPQAQWLDSFPTTLEAVVRRARFNGNSRHQLNAMSVAVAPNHDVYLGAFQQDSVTGFTAADRSDTINALDYEAYTGFAFDAVFTPGPGRTGGLAFHDGTLYIATDHVEYEGRIRVADPDGPGPRQAHNEPISVPIDRDTMFVYHPAGDNSDQFNRFITSLGNEPGAVAIDPVSETLFVAVSAADDLELRQHIGRYSLLGTHRETYDGDYLHSGSPIYDLEVSSDGYLYVATGSKIERYRIAVSDLHFAGHVATRARDSGFFTGIGITGDGGTLYASTIGGEIYRYDLTALSCADGEFCTQDDYCTLQGCTGEAKEDGLNCGAELPCKPQPTCLSGVCQNPVDDDGTLCDDGNECTLQDRCDEGQCIGGNPLVCLYTGDDSCKYADCIPGSGCVTLDKEDNDPCDDGDLCTDNDVCNSNGECAGAARECESDNLCSLNQCNSSTGVCGGIMVCIDDGDPCTSESCNPDTGNCHEPVVCADDGNLCTIESCDPETGNCVVETITCDDNNDCTDDACNPSTGLCEFTADATNSCSDGNACTDGDHCDGTDCIAGEALDCSDDDECTAEACDEQVGCVYPTEPGCACPDWRTDVVADLRLSAPGEVVGLTSHTLDLAAVPASNTVYAATVDGLFVTADITVAAPVWNPVTLPNHVSGSDTYPNGVTSVVANATHVFVGTDGGEGMPFYVLELGSHTVVRSAPLEDGQGPASGGIIRLAINPATGTILAGSRWGIIWRSTDGTTWTEMFTNNTGAHVAQFAFGDGLIIGATGARGTVMVSDDDGLTWTEPAFNFLDQHWPSAMVRWADSTWLVNAASSSNVVAGQYSCDYPCTTPAAVGNSSLMTGQIPSTVLQGVYHTDLVLTGIRNILASSDSELWYSTDDGTTYKLVADFWPDCTPGVIQRILVSGSTAYVATSVGVLRLDL